MNNFKFVIAEVIGAAALLAAMLGHILLMGAEIVSGAGIILIFISGVGYTVLTKLSRGSSSDRAYWILYGSKLAFIAALLLFAPLISKALAGLVNG